MADCHQRIELWFPILMHGALTRLDAMTRLMALCGADEDAETYLDAVGPTAVLGLAAWVAVL